jgi:hypothetical protein
VGTTRQQKAAGSGRPRDLGSRQGEGPIVHVVNALRVSGEFKVMVSTLSCRATSTPPYCE